MSLGTHVTNLRDSMIVDLLLEVEVVVLHVGSFDISVERENVAFEVAGGLSPKIGLPGYNRASTGKGRIQPCRKNRIRSDRVICWPR